MQGFIVSDFPQYREPFERDMKKWLETGEVVWEETVAEGLEHAVDALVGLFSGKNLGKMVVKL
jgi:NADPH-dependent curcumin reductase CurA